MEQLVCLQRSLNYMMDYIYLVYKESVFRFEKDEKLDKVKLNFKMF